MNSSVYWIRQASHTDMFSQGYIGVSGNLKKRWADHAWKPQNAHLANAIKKYGWDNLIKEVVLIAEDSYCYDIEAKLRPTENIGWNITFGGGKPPITSCNKGKHLSAETRAKISAAVKELMKDPVRLAINRNSRIGKSSGMKGLQHNAETRKKISLSHTGKPSKLKGTKISDEHKNKLIATIESQKWVCPHCDKTGKGKNTANRWHFNNCKKKELL
jgi:group I intron endonuclease